MKKLFAFLLLISSSLWSMEQNSSTVTLFSTECPILEENREQSTWRVNISSLDSSGAQGTRHVLCCQNLETAEQALGLLKNTKFDPESNTTTHDICPLQKLLAENATLKKRNAELEELHWKLTKGAPTILASTFFISFLGFLIFVPKKI